MPSALLWASLAENIFIIAIEENLWIFLNCLFTGLKKELQCETHSSSQKGFMKSRGQAVGAAEQELGVLDAQAAQQHGQAVDAQTKAPWGGQPYWKNSR